MRALLLIGAVTFMEYVVFAMSIAFSGLSCVSGSIFFLSWYNNKRSYGEIHFKTIQLSIMGKVLAYIGVSSNKQDVNNQKFKILEHAKKNDLTINDYIEVNVSSKASQKKEG